MLINQTKQGNLWIDDMRPAPEDYYWCKDYNTAIKVIKFYTLFGRGINHISFDHDLGEEKSGYDIAKYLVENQIDIKCFSVHSMNPVGRNNIIQLLTHYGYIELKQ